MSGSKLIIITSDFPYGSGEPFLETEILFLSKAFASITIISCNTIDIKKRSLPENCKVIRFNNSNSVFDKLLSITSIFDKLFWNEVKVVKLIYNKELSKGVISTILISLYNAKKMVSFIKSNLKLFKSSNSLIFYSYWYNDASLALALIGNSIPCIKVSRVHGSDLYFETNAFGFLPFRKFTFDRLDKIFSISIKGKSYILEHWKVLDNDKINVSKLGVQLGQKNYSNPKNTFLVLSCSNLIPVKRVHLIVEALSIIKSIKIKWIHIGSGLLKPEIEEKANQILNENIEFDFLGSLSNQEVMQFYLKNKPNLFINTSSSEGIPVSMMEAMSFGVPCLGTNVGGVSEIIENDINGYLMPSNPSPEEIAYYILKFYYHPIDKKIEMTANTFKTWEEKFNAEKNYTDFVNTIFKLQQTKNS